jgi:hypothetical protein
MTPLSSSFLIMRRLYFAKRADGEDRFCVRLAIDARKDKPFLRPRAFRARVVIILGTARGDNPPLVNLRDEFLLSLFAQTVGFGVLRLLLQSAVYDRQRILSVVLFQLGARQLEQLGDRLRQFQR